MSKKTTFEDAMQRLEGIVHELEQGNITLVESIKLFEEGAKLSASLTKQLDDAEQKVSLLVQQADGAFDECAFAQEEV